MPRIPSQTSTTMFGVGCVIWAVLAYAVHWLFPSRPFVEDFCSGLLGLGAYCIRAPQHAAPPAPGDQPSQPPAAAGFTSEKVT